MRAFEPFGRRPLISRGGEGVNVHWIPCDAKQAIQVADEEVERHEPGP